MRRSFLLILCFMIIAPALASLYSGQSYDPSQDLASASNFFKQFITGFQRELAALSIAAVAAMGVRAALDRYSKLFDDRGLNVTSVVLFLAMFLLVYSSPIWEYFDDIIGYLVISGFGVFVWGMFHGLKEAEAEPWDKVVGGMGCFVLAWVSFLLGLYILAVGLGAAGLLLVLLAIPAFNEAVETSGIGKLFGKKGRAPRGYETRRPSEGERFESEDDYDDAKEDIEKQAQVLNDELVAASKSLSEALDKIREDLS